jgi:hypothetical protein
VIYGLNAGGCYASYDQERRCLKMCQEFLFPMEDGFSTEFCLKFTKAGMMRNGFVYQLLKSGQGILETGFGLSAMNRAGAEAAQMWPTPTAYDWKGPVKSRTERGSKTYKHNLKEAVMLWPTPRANSGNGAGKHGDGGHDLQTAVLLAEKGLWPTPRTAGMCGGTSNWERLKEKCGSIEEARQMGAGNGGQLNPDWVEALMGYPQGCTDIDKNDVPDSVNYPARWLDGTWEEGIPRVAKKVKNRTKRIKGLGNAVVPQIPAILWRLIAGALW